MPMQVVGLGEAIAPDALAAGDLYVERGNGYALLVLAGPPGNDALDVVLGVQGDYFDETKPPYHAFRSAFTGNVAKVTGNIEIRPAEGTTPFLQPYVAYGSLALDARGNGYFRLKAGVWVDLQSGARVDKPHGVIEYDRWRIVWRDGERLETLATFGDPPQE